MIPRLTFGCGGRSHGGKWMMPFLITHKLIKESSFNQETNRCFPHPPPQFCDFEKLVKRNFNIFSKINTIYTLRKYEFSI